MTQLALFQSCAAPAMKREAADSVIEDCARMIRRANRRPRGSVQREFEKIIRLAHLPYVAVDEAKRCLFSNTKLRSFHFVTYSKHGSNWLVLCRAPNRDDEDDMREWEHVFGDGFKAVFAYQNHAREFVYKTLSGERLKLEELQ